MSESTLRPPRPVFLDRGALPEPDRDTPAERAAAFAEALTRPAVFLSASVPKPREHEADFVAPEAPLALGVDWGQLAQHLATPRTLEIREAVSWIAREAFARDQVLVFGGHPAITPMVLEVAQRQLADPSRIRVIAYQSQFFQEVITPAADDLARWPSGCMVLTGKKPKNPKDNAERNAALTEMRRRMLALPNLRAGIFVGGMSGLLEESVLLHALKPDAPRYALAETGGAAAWLLERHRADHIGRNSEGLAAALETATSFGGVVGRIFRELDTLG